MDSDENSVCFVSLLPVDDNTFSIPSSSDLRDDAAQEPTRGQKRHCRKRDDIRSSGSARPGETTNATRPYRRNMPASIFSLLRHYCLMLLIFGSVRWHGVMAIQLPDVYWNSTNPIFRIDNTDHIIDVNKSPAEYDRVNIFCPRIPRSPTGLSESGSSGATGSDSAATQNGYYIIYNVSKEEYETCRVSNPTARRMLVCDNPTSDRLSYVTITFRPFSPQPNGPEFHAGQDYYFITTSTGTESGLDNKFGGRCLSHNMKLLFKVAGQSPANGDNDDETKVVVSQAASPAQTTFKLSQQERLPVYETMEVEERRTTTIPFFFRPRTTPYRPRIMKYSPKPPVVQQIALNVIDTDNNDLPTGSDVRSSETNSFAQAVEEVRYRHRTTTQDYFNLIREEDAAVPARQTKSRPAASSSSSAAVAAGRLSVMQLLLLTTTLLAMPRMLQRF